MIEEHRFFSKSNEWYTPAKYVNSARRVMGQITLDPASSVLANRTVKADRIYTGIDDGLSKAWRGRVWMNPPYGRTGGKSTAGIWLEKLFHEYELHNVTEAIALVNAETANKWFQPLWDRVLCFTSSRIRFETAAGVGPSPTRGNVFVYVGSNVADFSAEFKQYGRIVLPSRKP